MRRLRLVNYKLATLDTPLVPLGPPALRIYAAVLVLGKVLNHRGHETERANTLTQFRALVEGCPCVRAERSQTACGSERDQT